MPGQEQGPNRQLIFAQPPEYTSAVENRHCEVEHHRIGSQLLGPPQRLRPVARFTHELQSLIRTDRARDVLTHERVIISDEN